MPQPTIFFSTNTGSNSYHASFIQRVCNEISTPSFTKQFRTVSLVTSNSIDILQELDVCRDEVAFFYFGGRAEDFQSLLDTSVRARYGSLFEYLTHLHMLDLVFLNYCSREKFVQPLLAGGIQTVISTSDRLRKAQATAFAAVFCQQYLTNGVTTLAAYKQAIDQASIPQGNQNRQFAGLHGDSQLRLRRWRVVSEPPTLRIIGGPTPHLVGVDTELINHENLPIRAQKHNLIAGRDLFEIPEQKLAMCHFASARIVSATETTQTILDNRLVVNSEYILQIEIYKTGSSHELTIRQYGPLQVSVYAEDMKIEPHWTQTCNLNQDNSTPLLQFTLKPFQKGWKPVRVDFYYQRNWLAKMELYVLVLPQEKRSLAKKILDTFYSTSSIA